MKKNLRIVSAAAAALLAVAPVAASTVSVNAADSSAVTNVTEINTKVPEVTNGATVNVTPNVTLNTEVPGTDIKTALNASFTATVNGTTAQATLTPNVSSAKMWAADNKGSNPNNPIKSLSEITNGDAGREYKVQLNTVSLNFGTANANKTVTLSMPDGCHFSYTNPKTNKTEDKQSQEVVLNQSGVVTLNYVVLKTTAKDFANPAIVNWRSRETGATVNTGDVTLYAGSDAGKMNVKEVLAAIARKYYAENSVRPQSTQWSYTSEADLAKQLADQGMKVTDGWFVANKTFTVNYKATANNNDASSTLVVTVNVPNGKEVTPATVAQVGTVKIMHAAYTYELKDGKLTRVTSADTLHAYNVIPYYGTTTVNGKKYYRVSGEHEWYINAGNVDGTSRTLNHNSYVYNNKGKRVKSEGTWKKGSKHTTYGAAMNIKGNRMYRVNKNRYVKVVNFD